MPSNPGQNLHLVSSPICAVASSSHLASSSSQLVVLSSYLVESLSHLIVSSILLTSPLLVYSSVILQLVVSHFNSPFSMSVYLNPSSGHAVGPLGFTCNERGMRIRGDLEHQRLDKPTAQAHVLPVLQHQLDVFHTGK